MLRDRAGRGDRHRFFQKRPQQANQAKSARGGDGRSQPAAEERKPKGERHRKPANRSRRREPDRLQEAQVAAPSEPAPAPTPKPHRPEPQGRQRRGKPEAESPSVVGLGDHVPAFLMRSYKVPARKAEAVES